MSATQVFEIHLISGEQIIVSHTLANLGRTSGRTETWPNTGPGNVLALCHNECNCLVNQYIYCFAKKRRWRTDGWDRSLSAPPVPL
jgi:hypothetical protein